MNAISIIVTTITTGAAAGLNSTANQAVRDAYTNLMALLRRKYPQADDDLTLLEAAPYWQTCQQGLAEDLEQAGAGSDEDMLQQAKTLLETISKVGGWSFGTVETIQGVHLLGSLGMAYHAIGSIQEANYYIMLMVILNEWVYQYRHEVTHPGDRQLAVKYDEQELAFARELGDRRAESAALSHLGLTYRNLSDAHKAIIHHEQALAIDRELGDRRAECQDLGNLGLVYDDLNEESKTFAFYSQYQALAREISLPHQANYPLRCNSDRPDADIAHLERYLKIYRDCGDYSNESSVLVMLGQDYAWRGEMRKALDCLDGARDIAHSNDTRSCEYEALIALGNLFVGLGDSYKGIGYYEEAAALARWFIRSDDEYEVLGLLGKAYAEVRAWDKVSEVYEKYLKLSSAVDHPHDEGNAWNSLGLAYAASNNVNKAIECYEQALAIERKRADHQAEYRMLGNLVIAHQNLGETQQAIACYEQQLAVARESGDRQGQADTCRSLGKTYVSQGDLAHAIPLLQACVDYERGIGHPEAERHAQGVQALRRKAHSDV